jgi:AcrR family transcriptional regulator
LPKQSRTTLEPRKAPVQARSTASVEAILKATIQVLIKVGKERLTTTLVAKRAGVSVGTLYQYFPNKSALLRAALQGHIHAIEAVLETVCREQAGVPLNTMAAALATGYLEAKMKDPKASVALYSVSSDVDGARIAREASSKAVHSIATMLASSGDELSTDPEIVAAMLQATLAGVSRRLLESASPEQEYKTLRDELVFLVSTYVCACSRKHNSSHSEKAKTEIVLTRRTA